MQNIKEEWRNEIYAEAREEEREQHLMRTDEDYFLNKVNFSFLEDLLSNFKKQCDEYGYDWSAYV